MSDTNNLISASNLAVAENLTASNILVDNIQSNVNLTAQKINVLNYATIPEIKSVNKVNNTTAQNLQSLDTIVSLTYQLQQLNNNLRAYIDQKIGLLMNNPDVDLNSINEIINYLNGTITNSINNKLDKTADSQTVAGNYIQFTGLNNSFANQFTTPDVLLLNDNISKSVNNTLVNLESESTSHTGSINTINNQITTINGRLDTDETNIDTNTTSINTLKDQMTAVNINYKINNDNTFPAPYITAELSRNNGFIINDSETLAGALGSSNTIMSLTQNVGNSNQYYLNTYVHRHTGGNGWQNSSMIIGNKVDTTNTSYIEFNPPNYLYGLGLYGGTQSGRYGLTIATDGKINVNSLSSVGLDTNSSSVKCNDLYFSYTDPILGNNTSALSQRWTAMYETLQNNIDISAANSTDITTLQNQIVSLTAQILTLKSFAPKAYGYWNGTSWAVGNQFIVDTGLTTTSGLYGLKFVLNIDTTYVQGVVVATPDGANGGYTCEAKYLGPTTIGSLHTDYVGIIVQMYPGGSQPSPLSTMSFYYTLI